ncbi:MAG: 3-isopropylmalate dehydratase small subunit [Planctomycetota bacterium]
MSGRVWKLGDHISTDLIAPGRLFHLRSNLPELAKHVFEDADPELAAKIKPGDFVVAGINFGCGSSREHAPTIIKLAGVAAVLAKSFARIFFRNAVNIGLPVVVCETDGIDPGDEIDVDLAAGVVKDLTKGTETSFAPLPPFMRRVLDDGGLVAHIQKHGDFAVE